MWKYIVCWIFYATVVLAKQGPPANQQIYACENDSIPINCNPGYLVRIVSAKYGRSSSKICPSASGDPNEQCSSDKALKEAQDRCNNQVSCNIPATNDVFGKVCNGSAYLIVVFQCVCEHECCENEQFDVEHSECEECCPPPDTSANCTTSPGCSCQPGFVRDWRISGKCVRSDKCPFYNPDYPQCVTPEVYNECGSNCTSTCQVNRDNEPCPLICVAGFFCKRGYIRNEVDGRCIKCEDCPCTET